MSLRIRAVSPEPPLLAHTSSESRGTFRQKARSLVSMNGWACAVKICHDGMLEDTNSFDAAQIVSSYCLYIFISCKKHTKKKSTSVWIFVMSLSYILGGGPVTRKLSPSTVLMACNNTDHRIFMCNNWLRRVYVGFFVSLYVRFFTSQCNSRFAVFFKNVI